AVFEIPESAGARSSALWKNDQRNAAVLDRLGGESERLYGGARIGSHDRDVTRSRQVPPEKRDAEKSLLGHETELHRNVREHHGRVHITGVIGGEHVAARRGDFIAANHRYFYAAHRQQNTRPGGGHSGLAAAAAIE